MQRLKEYFSLGFLSIVYLLASVRFFPGKAMQSLVETLIHILSVAPINLGATLVIVAVLQRLVGERLPLGRSIRIFLTAAIFLEVVLGLSNYYAVHGVS
ncbi:hypothetical protein ACUUL3_12040 [Thiovibrio sp. JS02]